MNFLEQLWKENKFLAVGIGVIALAATYLIYQAGGLPGFVVDPATGYSVVVPRMGSVLCEASGYNPVADLTATERVLVSASIPTTASCPGLSYSECLVARDACYADCGIDLFWQCRNSVCDPQFLKCQQASVYDTTLWKTNHPAAMRVSYTCRETNCKISAPAYGALSTFWSERFWKIEVNSSPKAGYNPTWNSTKFCNNDFPFTLTPISASSEVVVNKGDIVTVYVSAYRNSINPNFFGDDIIYSTVPRIPVQVTGTKLFIYADAAKIPISNTDGCLREDLLALVNYGNFDNYSRSYNLYTDASGAVISGLQQVDLPAKENLPTSLNPGEGWTFVFEWKELSTFYGSIYSIEGIGSVWVNKMNSNVYKLEPVKTSSGNYVVPRTLVLSNIECYENMRCTSSYGSGYFCKTTGGINDIFKCTAIGNPCDSDLDCTTYGTEQCSVVGGVPKIISGGGCDFTKGVCKTPSERVVKCCPGTCPAGQTCSNPDVGCEDTGCEIRACPGECCVQDPCYIKKDCSVGKHCVVTAGNAVGYCATDMFCGDGKCTPEIGESYTMCRRDCHLCGNSICEPLDTLNVNNPALYCPECSETKESCSQDCSEGGVCGNSVCDANENVLTCSGDCGGFWVLFAVVALVVACIAIAAVYFFKKKKKGKGRKHK